MGLVHGRRYDEFGVGDIIEDAKVGRSTFYDHYRGKDDMLVETMDGMLVVMADVAAQNENVAQLETVLRHFLDNRTFARHLFTSAAGREVSSRMSRELAKRIEPHLEVRLRARATTPAIPLSMIAIQVADAQFALVRAWLSNESMLHSSRACARHAALRGWCNRGAVIESAVRNDCRS